MLSKIFSIKNKYNGKKKHKIITILGLKLKLNIKNKQNCVIFIGPRGIGDYMFCRPYFKYIKKSPKYKPDTKIVYILQDIYVDMPRCYDSECFDEILAYNKDNYKSVISKINDKYNVLELNDLTPAWYADYKIHKYRTKIIKGIKCKQKSICVIALHEIQKEKLKNKLFSNYTNYICSTDADFELEKRRKHFEEILDMPMPQKTQEISPIFSFKDNHVAISIMSAGKTRMYPIDKWIVVLNYILENSTELKLLFLGSYKERQKIDILISKLNDKNRCINIAGISSIALLPSILECSKFLLSVETGTVHIAESVKCKTICLSNGSHYKRYHPYPTPPPDIQSIYTRINLLSF